MEFLQACKLIKEKEMWEEFVAWFTEWFENNMENEESILETTTILYAKAVSEL